MAAPLAHESPSPDETLALGERIAGVLTPGLTLALVGPLGAGKTLLVKGIARGNGLADTGQVTSPTFTLVHEYPGAVFLYHVDVYRLPLPVDLGRLGMDEMLCDGAVIVEWADRVREQLPPETLWIEIAVTGERTRRFMFRAASPSAERCLAVLANRLR